MSTNKKQLKGACPIFPPQDLDNILQEIRDVLQSGRLILGPKAAALEKAYAERVGVKYAAAVTSCTAALEIVYRHFVRPGQEVIVPTNTFVATATAVLRAGGKVVFADTNPDDFGIDVDDALRRVNSNTAAIVAVHVAGLISGDFNRLRTECESRAIPLIEDCAHAHGATWEGSEAGSLAQAGCFSFYPTKVLTCGTGGMVTTNDEQLDTLARSLRHHGHGRSMREMIHEGNDWLLDEVRAVVLHHQLRRLDEFLARRTAIADRYAQLLAELPTVTLPRLHSALQPAYFKYPILLPKGIDRNSVQSTMREQHGIETGAAYSPPCHLMPVFQKLPGAGPGALPNAEAILPRQLCLPMHAALEISDADRVVEALAQTLQSLAST